MNDNDLQLQNLNLSIRLFGCLKVYHISTISLFHLEVPGMCYFAEFSEGKGQ